MEVAVAELSVCDGEREEITCREEKLKHGRVKLGK